MVSESFGMVISVAIAKPHFLARETNSFDAKAQSRKDELKNEF
jgi:hypothetical protein